MRTELVTTLKRKATELLSELESDRGRPRPDARQSKKAPGAMAEVIWTEPALNDLDAIADYIALDDPAAARDFVQRVFKHVEQLIAHPDSGSKPEELRGWRYRQIIEPPCRILYRR